jgi:hypothetical protein
LISSSGQSLLTSLQVSAASDSQIWATSSTVISVAQSLSLLTTTVRASVAAISSMYSTSLSAHSSSSSGWIGRLALLKSVRPSQKKFEKPPPEPVELMSMLTSGFSLSNSSPIADISGKTVLDPAMLISPESPSLLSSPLWVQPARPTAPMPATLASAVRRVIPRPSPVWLAAITSL